MQYKDLLKKYIEESGLSLRQIEEQMKELGFSTNKSYISKLQNGVVPPAGDELNRALAKVVGGDPTELLLTAYVEKAPPEIKAMISDKVKTNHLYTLFTFLMLYVEEYREKKEINEEYLHQINVLADFFILTYNFFISTSALEKKPEYAVTLIAQLKRHFLPHTNELTAEGVNLDLSGYVDENGNPKFVENPYVDSVNENMDKYHTTLIKESNFEDSEQDKIIIEIRSESEFEKELINRYLQLPEFKEIIKKRNQLVHHRSPDPMTFTSLEFIVKAIILEQLKGWTYDEAVAALTGIESWRKAKKDIENNAQGTKESTDLLSPQAQHKQNSTRA